MNCVVLWPARNALMSYRKRRTFGSFQKPWTFNLPWERDNDYKILEYGCHEGNMALGNSLRGDRVMKEEAAKKKGTK